MADSFVFKTSLERLDEDASIFSKKEYIKLPDDNAGAYPANQVRFNLPQIANNDMYASLKQSFVEIPVVVNLEASTALDQTKQAFAVGLKGGYHNLVNSISLQIDNNNIISFTDLSNVPVHYKILSESSQDDALKLNEVVNFAKDSPNIGYKTATSVNGIGEFNNNIVDTTLTPSSGYGLTKYTLNKGLIDRMQKTSYHPASSTESTFTNASLCLNKRKTQFVATSTTVMTYHILMTIPLSYLSWDLFDNIPLTRGLFIKMVITLHGGQTAFTLANADGKISAITSTPSYNMIPFMVSPGEAGLYKGAADSVITVSCNVAQAGNTSVSSIFDKKCYMNLCMYKFKPEYEKLYLEKLPVKKVVYTDYITNNQLNIAPNGALNLRISSGIERMRWLLILTQLSASINMSTGVSGNYTAGNASAIAPMASPFTSSPCTCMKGTSWTNFNVRIGGRNFYPTPINYGYENYLNEILPLGVNGNMQLGLNSGLISQTDFESGAYGFVFVDLSRKVDKADDDANRSIEVFGTNNTLAIVDVYCYVGYEKSFNIDTYTGKLIA